MGKQEEQILRREAIFDAPKDTVLMAPEKSNKEQQSSLCEILRKFILVETLQFSLMKQVSSVNAASRGESVNQSLKIQALRPQREILRRNRMEILFALVKVSRRLGTDTMPVSGLVHTAWVSHGVLVPVDGRCVDAQLPLVRFSRSVWSSVHVPQISRSVTVNGRYIIRVTCHWHSVLFSFSVTHIWQIGGTRQNENPWLLKLPIGFRRAHIFSDATSVKQATETLRYFFKCQVVVAKSP